MTLLLKEGLLSALEDIPIPVMKQMNFPNISRAYTQFVTVHISPPKSFHDNFGTSPLRSQLLKNLAIIISWTTSNTFKSSVQSKANKLKFKELSISFLN